MAKASASHDEETERTGQVQRLEPLKPRALGEIAALVLAPRAEQLAHAINAQPVELVDRAKDRQPLLLVA